MSALDEAAELLRNEPVADLGKLLKAGGRHELDQEITRLAARGLRAHVLIAPAGGDLAPLHAVWTKLGLHVDTDLLLLFNGHRWEARGWALSPAAIDGALAAATPALHQYFGKGLASALANLAEASQRPPQPASSSAATGIGLGVGAVVALGAVGWVIVRRQRRAQEGRRSLADARTSFDKVFADVLIAAEDLHGPEASVLREKATRLREQMNTLAPPDMKQLPAKQESLTMAQLLQMENELEALRSSVLQAKRRP